MRVLLLLHRIPPLFPRQVSAALPLWARSEEEAPDQKQSHRKLVCQNVYKGKGRCNIWHTLQSHRLGKDLTPWASGFANIRSKSVCREGPQMRISSDSHRATIPPSASSLLFAVSVHLLPLQDHLIQLLQARLQALAIQSWASLHVVHGGGAELMKIQHFLNLKSTKENSQSRPNSQIRSFNHRKCSCWKVNSTFKSSTKTPD